jgi:hypothetical protein
MYVHINIHIRTYIQYEMNVYIEYRMLMKYESLSWFRDHRSMHTHTHTHNTHTQHTFQAAYAHTLTNLRTYSN